MPEDKRARVLFIIIRVDLVILAAHCMKVIGMKAILDHFSNKDMLVKMAKPA